MYQVWSVNMCVFGDDGFSYMNNGGGDFGEQHKR